MLGSILILAAVGLFGYAVYVRYIEEDQTQPVAKRAWTAVIAAGAAVGAAVMALVHP